MKILTNCTIWKRKEYSQSYGGVEKVPAAYIKEFDKEIWWLNDQGQHVRTLRKGTQLLWSFEGKEITERQFITRTNKAKKAFNAQLEAERLEREKQATELKIIGAQQLDKWIAFLSANPAKKERYANECKTRPSNASRSGNWRNWIRMKAAKYINGGNFNGMILSPWELRDALS